MRKQRYKKYSLFAIALLFICVLPLPFINGLRKMALSTISPLCKWGVGARKKIARETLQNEKKRLETQNHLLQLEVVRLKKALKGAEVILSGNEKTYTVEASVIYRDPASWTSGFWINVGENINKSVSAKVIEKNAMVLWGNALLGVIDEVQAQRSRVRLITDSTLQPSIRVCREGVPSFTIGVLQGVGTPLWRSQDVRLKGTCFHEKVQGNEKIEVHEGDLLLTSGIDGFFPPGLLVAVVTKVFTPRDGAYMFEIEAKPAAGNLNELTTVFVVSTRVN